MSFLRSSLGRKKKESSNPELLGFDLLYHLTYLSAVASAGIPRSELFKLAGKLSSGIAHYFRDVEQMARGLNYEYAEACRLVAGTAKEAPVSSFLLRLSNALTTGESESDFMAEEAKIQAELYINEYERRLDTLKQWTDAYVALMVSTALIVVVAAVSTFIYDTGSVFVAGMATITISVSALGAWVLYKTAPREMKTLNGPEGKQTQRVPRRVLSVLLPTALVAGVVAWFMGQPTGGVVLAVGIAILPIGVVSMRLDGRITKKDADISTFLRTLGSTASATGTTSLEALARMELRSMASLEQPAGRLLTKLRGRLDPDLCWNEFVSETGSDLIRRGVHIFRGGLKVGGDPREVGQRASLLTMSVVLLRAKRRSVSSTFIGLAMAMHLVIVFLLTFIVDVVNVFSKLLGEATESVARTGNAGSRIDVTNTLSIGFQNADFLQTLMVPVIISLSLFNAVAPKVTEGSYSIKFFLFLGVTLIVTGLSMIYSPILVNSVFQMVPIITSDVR